MINRQFNDLSTYTAHLSTLREILESRFKIAIHFEGSILHEGVIEMDQVIAPFWRRLKIGIFKLRSPTSTAELEKKIYIPCSLFRLQIRRR
jgi:hypothetical protein